MLARLSAAAVAGCVILSPLCHAQGSPDPAAGSEAPGSTESPTPSQRRILDNAIPLTPEMVRELNRRYGQNQRAREESDTQVASPISRPLNVTFAPGQATGIIQTVRGYPSAVSFFDNTGQPWPIAWDSNSNSASVSSGGSGGGESCNTAPNASGPNGRADVTGFQVCVPVRGGNTIQITPMSISPRGGLLVNLQGAPKPIAFMLMAGRDRYDAEISVHVSNRGPNARVQIDTRPNAPFTGAPFLTAMLSGVAPADATPLSVSGVSPDEARAWRLGDHVYLRTSYTLMSPPWDGSQSGEGNVTVYALPNTPVVLLSVNNRTVSAALKEER